MRFLIDENLPTAVAELFTTKGFSTKCVCDMPELRGAADEVIFDYAVRYKYIIVSRDLGFANYLRFDLRKLPGVILLRFPNEILITTLCKEAARLIVDLSESDFCNLLVIEPGSLRRREL